MTDPAPRSGRAGNSQSEGPGRRLDRLGRAAPQVREWYAGRAATEGWSRAVLETMVASDRHLRQGRAPSNFPATLPPRDSDLVQEIIRDPYVFDFVRFEPGYRERELQSALLGELRRLLLEPGTGFAVVGERYPLLVGGGEFFVDLLCYHTRLHRYVAFELKSGRFGPPDLGQSQFSVQAVDGQIRDRTVDVATIGVLLVVDRDETVVQYALQSSTAPVAVSRYQRPEEVRELLPGEDQLRRVGRQVTRDRGGGVDGGEALTEGRWRQRRRGYRNEPREGTETGGRAVGSRAQGDTGTDSGAPGLLPADAQLRLSSA